MAKTYNTISTFTAGQVLTAAQMNEIGTNSNNYRVPPLARITMTSNVAVANGSHTDFAGFLNTNSTETFDTDGMVSLSGTASAITVQTAGVYSCTGVASWAGSAAGLRVVRIVRSRAGTLVNVGAQMDVAANADQPQACAGIIDCNVGDLIRLMVFQNTGGALNLGVNGAGAEFSVTHLAVAWVGQTS